MNFSAKSVISNLFSRFGYQIRRNPDPIIEAELTPFENCLLLMLGMHESINILQVGANDGCINDPLFRFAKKYPLRTRLILVEPQKYLIPILKKQYQFHPEKEIFNVAIGHGDPLKMYTVKESAWRDLLVPYAKDWPVYRAPTGVTSTDLDLVLQWLSRHYKGKIPLNETIDSFMVDTVTVETLLSQSTLFKRMDVLLVDAEGYDDQIIYTLDMSKTRPHVINFEMTHLSADRSKCLNEYLWKHGYAISMQGPDSLAILTEWRI